MRSGITLTNLRRPPINGMPSNTGGACRGRLFAMIRKMPHANNTAAGKTMQRTTKGRSYSISLIGIGRKRTAFESGCQQSVVMRKSTHGVIAISPRIEALYWRWLHGVRPFRSKSGSYFTGLKHLMRMYPDRPRLAAEVSLHT